MTLGERIRSARAQKNMSQADVARQVKVTVQAISQWESGKTTPSGERLMLLADILDMDLSPSMQSELHRYRPSPDERVTFAPVLNSVQISNWARELTAPGDAVEHVPVSWKPEGLIFAFRIEDNAMLPEFRPTDIVIVDPGLIHNPGDFVLAALDTGEFVFRKFRQLRTPPTDHEERFQRNAEPFFELVPLNIDFSRTSAFSVREIIGCMVEHRRFKQYENTSFRTNIK